MGIPVYQPQKLTQPGEWERLRELRPDFIVVAAYGQILKPEVLALPRFGCVNIHSSLLPRWRGAAPIQWAILSGDAESGVTTMRMVEKLDAGEILLQAKTPIGETDTARSLHDRLAVLGAELIVPTLEGLANGSLRGQPQEESQVTYASKLSKEMEVLNPREPAEVLDRRVRALSPWPGTSIGIRLDGAPIRLKIKEAKARRDIAGKPGQIFERSGMILFGTIQGSLELRKVQWEGKKEIDPNAFINGLRGRGIALPLEGDERHG
jgi:methionyl-tRNA formyltransferase